MNKAHFFTLAGLILGGPQPGTYHSLPTRVALVKTPMSAPAGPFSIKHVLDSVRPLPLNTNADSAFAQEIRLIETHRPHEVMRYRKAFTEISNDSVGFFKKATDSTSEQFAFFVPADKPHQGVSWQPSCRKSLPFLVVIHQKRVLQ